MHKVSRERILESCQIQDKIIQVMDLRRMRWIEKPSYMDVNSRVPRLLFRCWLYGNDYVRNTKPLKTIAHSYTNSLRRIARASLAAGEQMIEPFEAAQDGTIMVGAEVQPLFKLVQSEEWPRMMERHRTWHLRDIQAVGARSRPSQKCARFCRLKIEQNPDRLKLLTGTAHKQKM